VLERRTTFLKEFRFLSSTRVPRASPGRCTETFTSQRRLPFSMSHSETPAYWSALLQRVEVVVRLGALARSAR
jgi:hypothetical protein